MSNPFSEFREGMREGFDRAAYEAGMRDAHEAWQHAAESARVSDEQAQRATAPRQGAATLLAPAAAPAAERKGGKGMRVGAMVCATLVVLAYIGKPASPATATPVAPPAATVTVTATPPQSAPASTPASDAPTASTAPTTADAALPPMAQCAAEDGSTPGQSFPCVWSAKDRGNGTGRTYVLHGPQH